MRYQIPIYTPYFDSKQVLVVSDTSLSVGHRTQLFLSAHGRTSTEHDIAGGGHHFKVDNATIDWHVSYVGGQEWATGTSKAHHAGHQFIDARKL